MTPADAVQPTLPGIGPVECTGEHDLVPWRGRGWSALWRRCSVCHIGVFLLRRGRR